MTNSVVTVHVKVGDVEIFGEYDDGTVVVPNAAERKAARKALKNALRVLNSPVMDELAVEPGAVAERFQKPEPAPRPRLRLVK